LASTKRRFQHIFSHDIAVDLGTANTLVALNGFGIVINEPSVVATNRKTGKVIAIGKEAKKMVGRTPRSIIAAQPLVDGVVSDFEVTEHMLKHFVETIHKKHRVFINRPRMVIGLPYGVTEVEKRAVEEAAKSAGARKIWLIEEPVAAAIGSGMNILEERGGMIVDIGGGTTEIAVLAGGRVVVARSLRIAGDEMTEAVSDFIRDEYNLLIGERTAEQVKIKIGQVGSHKHIKEMKVRGRNILTGLPQEIKISSEAIRKPLSAQIKPIIDAVKTVVEETPPELISDIMERGVVIAGGGALIDGIDKLIKQEIQMKVVINENSLTAVVEGAAEALRNSSEYNSILMASEK
jgi:rod shape-determining protein MreB